MGRPRIWSSPEDMQRAVDRYLIACKGHPLTDRDGDVITDKYGIPVIIDSEPLTITGLALALGFRSRQSLLNYAAMEIAGEDGEAERPYLDTIARAKAEVERYAEVRLYDKDGVTGAKFNLANNFAGWKERPDGADVQSNTVIHVTLTDD